MDYYLGTIHCAPGNLRLISVCIRDMMQDVEVVPINISGHSLPLMDLPWSSLISMDREVENHESKHKTRLEQNWK